MSDNEGNSTMSKSNQKQLKKYRIQRGQIKGQLTKFQQFLNQLNEDDYDITSLKIRWEKIEPLWKKYDNLQLEIEMLDETELNRLDEREEFENTFLELETVTKKLIQSNLSSNNSTIKSDILQPMQINQHSIQSRIELPRISLPTFDGKYDEWLSFNQAFTSLISMNPTLTNSQKFQYLRSTLKGETIQLLENLETTDENYKIAWDLLESRYNQKKLIINKHLKDLLEYSPVMKENANSIRKFIDNIIKHTRALISMGEEVKSWDTLLLYTLSNKLDLQSRKEWEIFVAKKPKEDMPTMEEFLSFLTNRAQTLELMEKNIEKFKPFKQEIKHENGKQINKQVFFTAVNQSCFYCSKDHPIYRCETFKSLSIEDRQKQVNQLKLCGNCLRKGHFLKECKNIHNCKFCGKRHNTLLHKTFNPKQEAAVSTNSVINHIRNNPRKSYILLATALVNIYDKKGQKHSCRALIDPGSQSHLISNRLQRRLQLETQSVDIPVSGVNNTKTTLNKMVTLQMESRRGNFKQKLECYIVPIITEILPQVQIDINKMNIPQHIELADPDFHTPGEIDLLIGAQLFLKMLGCNKIESQDNQPSLQETKLGWIVAGEIHKTHFTTPYIGNMFIGHSIEDQIERFWKQEEILIKHPYSNEEQACERHFQETIERNTSGRFVVSLPRKNAGKLGDSLSIATKRFKSIEKRLSCNPKLKEKYEEFMNEYQDLNHMSLIPENEVNTENETYYLPHHPVINESSLTTKVRIVFDGSASTSSGISLNNTLMVGPVVQNELINILIKFRTHQIVITADVEKMYRQIEVNKKDRDLQRIIWRKNPNEEFQHFHLNTVTYGTSSAPFLATRCLIELAKQDGDFFPLAKSALMNDFYVDDLLTGTSSVEEAIILQKDLDLLLQKGQFNLRKWRSNSKAVLENIPNAPDTMMIIDKNEPIKTLGLLWNSEKDIIEFNIQQSLCNKIITKRVVLSTVAKIFDPLGLLGPILTKAKVILQLLWQSKCDWDDPIPQEISQDWRQYYDELQNINDIKIPRNINPGNLQGTFTLHGFCDASESAYGACIYAVTSTSSILICAKSRVAPLKTISLPRLELNGAFLLSKLATSVSNAISEKVEAIHLWSDSTIVLSWINTPANLLKTFVANRTSTIQHLTSKFFWHYVPSKQNPADLISRGCNLKALHSYELWWNGPDWINNEDNWPNQPKIHDKEVLELKKQDIKVHLIKTTLPVLTRFSSFTKLKRVIATCIRFLYNARNSKTKITGELSPSDLQAATLIIAKMIQAEAFAEDIHQLEHKKTLKSKSRLLNLHPFLDENNVLRVGGRIHKANITYAQKHQIILPPNHHVTDIIIEEYHKTFLHCGQEQLLSQIRQLFWILNGRQAIKKILRKCVKCFRYNPISPQPLMGDLPEQRVTQHRPFSICGVDYAGPIQIRQTMQRGKFQIIKAYIAIFICFSTKAVHIELVSNLTTEAFLACLRRFIGRRGVCSHIHSDNGTNFIGANNYLKELYMFLNKNKSKIEQFLTNQQIQWHFIPPRSPHFGGLWESTVKVVKKHFFKVTQSLILTFEETLTLLIEIEAILNSRPLTPLSPDPNDFLPLTPSHFLIGDSIKSLPEYDFSLIASNRLSRWEHIQKVKTDFWKRWHAEYLQTLQKRQKWASNEYDDIKVGELVLLMDSNLPPLKWLCGRVISTHPNPEDNIVRVVSVKTPHGLFTRAVRKVCRLPI